MRIDKAFPLALLLLLCGLTACSDETAPEPDPYMIGTVTDAAGQPVAGASVALVFGIDGVGLPGWEDPTKRLKTEVRFSLADTGRTRLWIENYLRQTLIVLVDEEMEPGTHSITWDGLDGAGEPVPPGLYYFMLQAWSDGPDAPPMESESRVFLFEHEPAALLQRAHAVTDAQGRFEVPLALFPIGEEFQITGEGGEDLGMEAISNRVHVFAIVEDGPGVRYVDRYVRVSNRQDPVRVDLQLP